MFRACILIAVCLLIFSCERKDIYLYDKTGFVNPKPYVPQYVPHYQPYSRGYYNPYRHPPRNYYPYYDFDYYYVPPTRYLNIDANQNSHDPNLKY